MTENIDRRNRMLKRYEIYRDNTKKWVMENLAKEQLKDSTLSAMENRASNISICRKIVNKLARCYVGGVQRITDNEQQMEAVENVAKIMCIDSGQKKSDRYRQLFRNSLTYIVPHMVEVNGEKQLFEIRQKILPPYLYDVIEDPKDKERPKVVILNEFKERNIFRTGIREGEDGRGRGIVSDFHEGDHIEQNIADERSDSGQEHREFIWWSDKYHFTTDSKGIVIPAKSPDDLLNPIQKLPFINVAEDQDGEFWAEGGDDLIDGSVLINALLTDMNAIAYTQGWGQMVITGTNIPKEIRGGPHNALRLEHDADAPVPTVTYANSNAPMDTWMNMVEQQTALILSTNDLSPGNISAKLDPSNFASGVAMLIEQSEHTASIEDKQKLFQDVEREMWHVISKWQALLASKNSLTPELKEAGMIGDADVTVLFSEQKPAASEAEKLTNIKIRKELGINTMAELIMLDNSGLTLELAEEKILKIQEEKQSRMAAFMPVAKAKDDENDEEKKEDEDNEDEEEA